MKEDEIRADDLRDEPKRLYKIDQKRLLEKKNDFAKTGCPACQKESEDVFYERAGFTFVKCDYCDTVFVSPRPTKEMLHEHYTNSLAEKCWSESIYPASEEARIKYLMLPRVKSIIAFCKKYNIKPGVFMDVGAGNGAFCEQVKKTGFFEKVIAVEPNPNPASSCKEKGIEVIEDIIENIKCHNVNVVTSIESIEHVFDPIEYITRIGSMIEKGGLLFLTTPNVKGFDILILKDKSDNTTAPDHLNYFHPDSMTLMLQNNGFKVLEILTPGKLDVELVRKAVLSEDFSLDNNPFLKRIIIEEFEKYGDSFQGWISENGLSSHMWVVAKKQ